MPGEAMNSPRITCFVTPADLEQARFDLSPEEARHVGAVMRARVGDLLLAVDGQGGSAECRITACSRRHITLEVVSLTRTPRAARRITLIQAILKTRAMDDVIQRAVEIGVDRIIPVFCRHGVSKPVQDDSKIERWRKIAISAIKQSSQSWLPEMCFPHSLSAGLDLCQNHALCYGSLQADSRALYDWHQSVDAGLHLGLAIGPEGDFHQEELDLFSTRNVAPIWLGPHIMRSETATLAGLAQLNAMRHAADPNSG